MPRSKAVDRAIKKYDAEKVDKILFRVPKGKKVTIQSHAADHGESLTAFLNRAIDETMQRDRAGGDCESTQTKS
jgi:hypothetical protein